MTPDQARRHLARFEADAVALAAHHNETAEPVRWTFVNGRGWVPSAALRGDVEMEGR